jgi:hypothetical protein
MLQGQTQSVHFFLDPSVLWALTVRKLSETSNDYALCCVINLWNTVVQLLHCLPLSSFQLESTPSPAAHLLLSQSEQGDLVGHHLRLSNFLREFLDPVVKRFTRQTLSTVNRKHPFMNILLIESFCPQKRATKRCSSVVYPSSTVAILIAETSL